MKNRGFAAAVNQGFRALTTKYVLLLNPDADLRSGLESLQRSASCPGVGAAAGRTVGPDGHVPGRLDGPAAAYAGRPLL